MLRLVMLLVMTIAPAAASAQSSPAADAVTRFKARAEAVVHPVGSGSAVIPGAFWQVGVTTLLPCVTRIEPKMRALGRGQTGGAMIKTGSGIAPSPLTGAVTVDWSKVRATAFDHDQRVLVLGIVGGQPVALPYPPRPNSNDDIYGPAYLKEVLDLQIACRAFSASAAGLPAGVTPWPQVRSMTSQSTLACTYARVPQLMVMHRLGGGLLWTWRQAIAAADGRLSSNSFSIHPYETEQGLVWEFEIWLEPRGEGDKKTRATSIETRLDGKPVPLSAAMEQSPGTPAVPGWSSLILRSNGNRDDFVGRLMQGSLFEVRAFDADHREVRRATFDVRTVRDIVPALKSTGGQCIIG